MKKAIGPIISIVMFLAVVIGGYLLIDGWLLSYTSGLSSKSEVIFQKEFDNSEILKLYSSGTFVIRSTLPSNVRIGTVRINGNNCNITSSPVLLTGINTVNVSVCSITSSEFNDVLVATSAGILRKEIYAE